MGRHAGYPQEVMLTVGWTRSPHLPISKVIDAVSSWRNDLTLAGYNPDDPQVMAQSTFTIGPAVDLMDKGRPYGWYFIDGEA